jgi:inner membrane protein
LVSEDSDASADVVCDLRYAVLPHSVKPLWGIRIERSKVGEQVTFESFREVSKEERAALLRMLKGQDLGARESLAEPR